MLPAHHRSHHQAHRSSTSMGVKVTLQQEAWVHIQGQALDVEAGIQPVSAAGLSPAQGVLLQCTSSAPLTMHIW
jgi:hypothetical protein